ncbi:MAG: flagellar biosynthetic protein FliO [Pseudomonadota bacterium]
MTEFFVGIFGEDFAPIATTIFALLVALLLILFVYFLARQVLGPQVRGGNRGRAQRLQVMDASPVDGKRRIVLVRRDDVEHLVMIGGPNDLVIEPRIQRGQPTARPRPTPSPEQIAALRAAQQQQAAQPTPAAPPATGRLAAGVAAGAAGVAAVGAAGAALAARPPAAEANPQPVAEPMAQPDTTIAAKAEAPSPAAIEARRRAEARAEAASRVAKEQAEAERREAEEAEKAEQERAKLAEAESRGELGFGRGALTATAAAGAAGVAATGLLADTPEAKAEVVDAEPAPTPPEMPEPVKPELLPEPVPDMDEMPAPESPVTALDTLEPASQEPPAAAEIDMGDLESSLTADLDLSAELEGELADGLADELAGELSDDTAADPTTAERVGHNSVPMFKDPDIDVVEMSEIPDDLAPAEDTTDDTPEEPDEVRSSLEDEMDRLLGELSGDGKS